MLILLSSSSTASICAHDICLLTIYPNTTDPLPPAPATTVPSWDQLSFMSEPLAGLWKEYDHPLLSQRRSISKEPTAKQSPLGAHLTEVITWSQAEEAQSWRPYWSQTRYLQSSPQETMVWLPGFQSQLSTMPSWAFQVRGLLPGRVGTMVRFLSQQSIISGNGCFIAILLLSKGGGPLGPIDYLLPLILYAQGLVLEVSLTIPYTLKIYNCKWCRLESVSTISSVVETTQKPKGHVKEHRGRCLPRVSALQQAEPLVSIIAGCLNIKWDLRQDYTESFSGLQTTQQMGLLPWITADLSMPPLDHILICPSSPLVAIAAPSLLHLMDIIALACASAMFFSILPALVTSLKLPSLQARATTSEGPLPEGSQSMSMTGISMSMTLLASGSPLMSHLSIDWSSETEKSSPPFVQPTQETMSECLLRSKRLILNFIFRRVSNSNYYNQHANPWDRMNQYLRRQFYQGSIPQVSLT